MIDLLRVGVGAYAADRRLYRGVAFVRTIHVHIQTGEPAAWVSDVLRECEALLHWLSGDRWHLSVGREGATRYPSPEPLPGIRTDGYHDVALLSGGADSFCGALLADPSRPRLHVGHYTANHYLGVQNAVASWLRENATAGCVFVPVRLVQPGVARERSTRSRSFLFYALAALAASAFGARRVEVPENGFTSINPPLTPGRTGALSTRSTHPATLERFNGILTMLGMDQHVANPHQQFTKGELLAAAASKTTGFTSGFACTLSCGFLGGHRYKGGDVTKNCGACVPCLVRRAAASAAGVTDHTRYLADVLGDRESAGLLRDRRCDVLGVLRACKRPPTRSELRTRARSVPEGVDVEEATETCQRGLDELKNLTPMLEKYAMRASEAERWELEDTHDCGAGVEDARLF